MNELGTSVDVYNMNNYIWYIVGGVALFFVIVGFIADKSGLAKKTFSKDTKKVTDKPVGPEQTVSVENNVVDPFAVNPVEMNPTVAEMPQTVIEDNLNYENNNVTMSEENGIVGETEPLYISEEPEIVAFEEPLNVEEVQPVVELTETPVVIENSNIENDADVIWNNDEKIEEVVTDSFENSEISEDVSSENTEKFTMDTTVSDIAAADAETEWGVDSISENTEANNSIEVELPNLEDIEINAEDDVWKF